MGVLSVDDYSISSGEDTWGRLIEMIKSGKWSKIAVLMDEESVLRYENYDFISDLHICECSAPLVR